MQPSAGSSPGLPFVGTELPSEVHGGVRYQIERVLGQGGTAVAYFATRQAPDGQSPVVVKVILPRLVMESGDHAQTIVKKEAVALGRLNERVPPTPFVVRLMDTGSVSFAYFGRSGNSDKSSLACADTKTCTDEDLDPNKKKYLFADISLGVGVVSLGVATYLLLSPSSKTEPAKDDTAVRFDVVPSSRGGFATVSGAF